MGIVQHDAIVVVSWNDVDLDRAWNKAKELELPTSSIVVSPLNGYRSFLIAPDGSQRGWEDDVMYEQRRAVYVTWLLMNSYPDGSASVDFVTLKWGEEMQLEAVERHDVKHPEFPRDMATLKLGVESMRLTEAQIITAADAAFIDASGEWPPSRTGFMESLTRRLRGCTS